MTHGSLEHVLSTGLGEIDRRVLALSRSLLQSLHPVRPTAYRTTHECEIRVSIFIVTASASRTVRALSYQITGFTRLDRHKPLYLAVSHLQTWASLLRVHRFPSWLTFSLGHRVCRKLPKLPAFPVPGISQISHCRMEHLQNNRAEQCRPGNRLSSAANRIHSH